MEIIKISETEVMVRDNSQIEKVYSVEDLTSKIEELERKRNHLVTRKNSKSAMFDKEIEPLSMELLAYSNMLGYLK